MKRMGRCWELHGEESWKVHMEWMVCWFMVVRRYAHRKLFYAVIYFNGEVRLLHGVLVKIKENDMVSEDKEYGLQVSYVLMEVNGMVFEGCWKWIRVSYGI